MLKSIAAAFSMYSAIPMPYIEWDEKTMRYAFCYFPLVGAVLGLCEYLAFVLRVIGQNVLIKKFH